MNRRLAVALTLVPAIAAIAYTPAPSRAAAEKSFAPPSSAPNFGMRWKINTHLFAANVVLADAKDGFVDIPPFGDFPIAPAARAALNEFPAVYRAGVIGPDLFPDMYIGGWHIHSDLSVPEKWIADNWLRLVWTRARAWDNPSDRNKVMAFAYGFLTHGAGDMFAHTWVNEKAQGAWRSFEGAEGITARRHVVLEGFVGEHTPGSNLSIDVSPKFVSEVLIKSAAAREHSKGAKHYPRFLAIYEALEKPLKIATDEMNSVGENYPYWYKCTANPKACARKEYIETWRRDINSSLRAMVDSSESLGEALMDPDQGALEGVGAMTGWAKEWLPKIYGMHAVGEGAATLSELLEWVNNYVPIDAMIKAEVEQFMEQELPKIWELYVLAKKPSSYWNQVYPAELKGQVVQEMGVAPGGHTFNWREFEPIYNTVMLSKLALLDGRGLNLVAQRAGVAAPIVPEGDDVNIMLGVFRSMTQSYQWKGEEISTETEFGICGPEHIALPRTARCGVPYAPRGAANALSRSASGQGFVLWGNEEARTKIFHRVFKGLGGAGPGTVGARAIADVPPALPGSREARRALRTGAEHVERMREVVYTMQGKIGGTAPATQAGSLRLGQRGAAPRAAAAPAPTDNWGQRCCAKDVAELRASLQAVHAAGSRLQNPALLAQFGRKPSAAQMGARALQANAALAAFANSRDAASAAAALANLSRHIEALAAVVAGTQ